MCQMVNPRDSSNPVETGLLKIAKCGKIRVPECKNGHPLFQGGWAQKNEGVESD